MSTKNQGWNRYAVFIARNDDYFVYSERFTKTKDVMIITNKIIDNMMKWRKEK